MSERSGTLVQVIWKELYDGYKELKGVGERSHKPRLVIAGTAEADAVGLYAALFGEAESIETHETAEGEKWVVLANFTIDDLPGRGAIGATGAEERALAFIRESDAVAMVVLGDRRPTQAEVGLFEHVRRLRRCHLVVANAPAGETAPEETPKLDDYAWEEWKIELGRLLDDADVPKFPVRYLDDTDLVAIAKYLYEKLGTKFELGFIRELDHEPSRDSLVRQMITGFSSTAGILGLNPLTFPDIVAITPVQVLMVLRIAACYGRKVSPGWARDFIATTGVVGAAGYGFRTLYKSVVKAYKPAEMICWALGGGTAFSGTQIIGHAARLYFRSGEQLTPLQAAQQARAEVGAQPSVLDRLLWTRSKNGQKPGEQTDEETPAPPAEEAPQPPSQPDDAERE